MQQWESVDYEHYELVVNGQTRFDVHEAARLGTYNMLLHDSPLYDAKSASFEESHDLFMTAFKNGFPWELLEILSGKCSAICTCIGYIGGGTDNIFEGPTLREVVERDSLISLFGRGGRIHFVCGDIWYIGGTDPQYNYLEGQCLPAFPHFCRLM